MEFNHLRTGASFHTFQAADALRRAQIFGDVLDVHGTLIVTSPAVGTVVRISLELDGRYFVEDRQTGAEWAQILA